MLCLKGTFRRPVTRKLLEIKKAKDARRYPKVNKERCVRCGSCEMGCPSGSIKLKKHEYPEFDISRCCYCGLCEKVCPQKAITLNRVEETTDSNIESKF
ncbi:MAG: 4Fe-4S binding protein [Holosporales bacterium]|jgi:formate hydrogenlyase subunit 6/NADH:ubiquinone oxidoreductase subunit I|nr:4Fe-4S binding protein [Holosporales bacterium]